MAVRSYLALELGWKPVADSQSHYIVTVAIMASLVEFLCRHQHGMHMGWADLS